jgi:hypothetical protein
VPLIRDLDATVATFTAWLVTVPGFEHKTYRLE